MSGRLFVNGGHADREPAGWPARLRRSAGQPAGILLIALFLSGCSKEAAVNRGLTDAGIAAPAASCMAREMSKRLTAGQLRKLGRVADGSGRSLAEMSAADYLAAARRVGDPEVIVVTGAAAAYCDAL